MSKAAQKAKAPARAQAQCACAAVVMEIAVPAQWAWHDHSAATQRAHGAAYATYVGSWRSRFAFVRGEAEVRRYQDPDTGAVRSFCGRCGTPVLYERKRARNNVNIPRALFASGVGREPRYHIGIDQIPEWAYDGEALKPLKGFPGVVWNGGKRRRA